MATIAPIQSAQNTSQSLNKEELLELFSEFENYMQTILKKLETLHERVGSLEQHMHDLRKRFESHVHETEIFTNWTSSIQYPGINMEKLEQAASKQISDSSSSLQIASMTLKHGRVSGVTTGTALI